MQVGPYQLLFLLVVAGVLVVPYFKLWSRTGHSGWWSLLMILPLINIISLYVLAFKEWPAMSGNRAE